MREARGALNGWKAGIVKPKELLCCFCGCFVGKGKKEREREMKDKINRLKLNEELEDGWGVNLLSWPSRRVPE